MADNKNLVLFKTKDGKITVDVTLEKETVWLTQDQMAELFGRERSVITKHLRNVFKEGELNEKLVRAKYAHTAADGKTYQAQFYNLDVIISVGYRVKSHRGTQFRQWATNVLKEHLVKGYTINQKRLQEQQQKFDDLRKTVALLEKTVQHQAVQLDEAKGLLQVITDYAYALTVLDEYDHQALKISKVTQRRSFILNCDEAMRVIQSMKGDFAGLFGTEKDQSFKSSLGAIYQTFRGKDLYPSIEEKAAHLLYFVVKNHSFADGNKRIAAAMFIYFLGKNGILYHDDGSKRIGDNALVALTLMIAESKPSERDTIVKVVVNLINKRN